MVAVVVVAIKKHYIQCIALLIKAIHIICIVSLLFISACSHKKASTVKLNYQEKTYQHCLEAYVGKQAISLVKKIGAPDMIRKDEAHIIFEWRSVEQADRKFWWIGTMKCITRIFINPTNGRIEDVFSYGNGCIPF